MDPRPLTPRDLRDIISDHAELLKGVAAFTAGDLAHLSRFEDRLYAEAAGSGASAYKVQVHLGDLKRGRCSCMAARTRPFCKHASALLYAWATQPTAFAVAAEAPAPAAGEGTAKREVKRGKVDGNTLVARGVEQVLALVGELGTTGFAAMGGDRAEQVRALAEPLRANRLRRLSARVLELADLLDQVADGDAVDAVAWTDLLADLLLSARKIEKHLAGEGMEDRYVETLIGKSWTKKDRVPVTGLDLVEIAWWATVTPDDFRIVESRYVDLATGDHWSEKQILPMMIARRTEPKPSRAGLRLGGAAGSRFPGFAPYRLDLESPGLSVPLDETGLARLLEVCLPSVGDTLIRLTELRRDVLAPDLLPVAVRVDTLLAGTGRLRLVDARGDTLFLPEDRALGDRVAEALRDVELDAVFGDVGLDGALPTLYPLALLVRGGGKRSLVRLVGGDAASMRGKRPRRMKGAPARRWVEVARAAGVSRAAVTLGEAREELAQAVANGTVGFTPRAAEAGVARLRELGLEKPALVVAGAAQKGDPRERLDDLIKVHQVTGIALVRLAGAVSVDRTTLVAVPTYPSVSVPRLEERLAPAEVARRVGEGRLDRFSAAVAYDAWYRAVPPEDLAAAIYPAWADASASPFVARAFADRREVAVAAACSVLLDPRRAGLEQRTWPNRGGSRTACLTAVRVLAAAEARTELTRVQRVERDVGILAHVRHALAGLPVEKPGLLTRLADAVRVGLRSPAPVDPALRSAVLTASLAEERVELCQRLAAAGDLDAIPLLRVAYATDVTERVRAAAALALAGLIDLESADRFLEGLGERDRDDAAAKVAARALGQLGDYRALGPLLDAYANGWHPNVCIEAIAGLGSAATGALVEFMETRPELAKRGGVKTMINGGAGDVGRVVVARIAALVEHPDFAARAGALLSLLGGDPAEAEAARLVMARRPDLETSKDPEAKALVRRCRRAGGKG